MKMTLGYLDVIVSTMEVVKLISRAQAQIATHD